MWANGSWSEVQADNYRATAYKWEQVSACSTYLYVYGVNVMTVDRQVEWLNILF